MGDDFANGGEKYDLSTHVYKDSVHRISQLKFTQGGDLAYFLPVSTVLSPTDGTPGKPLTERQNSFDSRTELLNNGTSAVDRRLSWTCADRHRKADRRGLAQVRSTRPSSTRGPPRD